MVRKLSAIMFTDMVGYTALMQADESLAKDARDRQRRVLESAVLRHGGQVLQVYGDGTLSTFDSAVEAVRCAVEVQVDLQSEPPVPLRIGVHVGDIVHDEHGVYGDGVNVASRIQEFAAPGSVLITGKVVDEVKNHPELVTHPLGSVDLKHVNRPVHIFAVTGRELELPEGGALRRQRSPSRRSIAVLPFVNMSADPANEFFSDGITEEIINALTQLRDLRVTARTSSFAFKHSPLDIREIAEQLGVTHVLEGSVRRAGDRVRVTAQLICARDGYHLLSETYDRSLDDVFAVQDEVSHAIVDALLSHLSNGPEATAAGPTPKSAHAHDGEAYEEYLRGRFEWGRFTADGARRAIGHFQRSARMDPHCALPHTGLARSYVLLGAKGEMPASEAFPLAEQAALRALELEPDAGESHLALGSVRLFFHWDLDGAHDALQRALWLTPGSAAAHHTYAIYLEASRRFEEAVDEMRTAVELDPLSVSYRQSLAQALLAAGRLEEALQEARRVLAMDPSFRAATETLGWIHVERGELDRALRTFDRLPQQSGVPWDGAASRGYVFGRLERWTEVSAMVELVDRHRESRPGLGLEMEYATIHLGSGELERTIAYLKKAIDARLPAVLRLASQPRWQALCGQPGFDDLIASIGLQREVGTAS